ncbi:MAG TPA: GNAT family N-acetyltransferase [Burkholderiaceae bacterium]|nr:GNAT family N-acetyltransferase [Burkholderiaceae bacterium]
MTIRRAVTADAPLFERFTRQLYAEVTASTHDPFLSASADSFVVNWASWFQLHIGRETGLVLIAEDPAPAGFIAAYVSPPIFGSEIFPLVGVIGMWWVDAGHRRHGIGRQLLDQAETWLRQGGMKYVETHYMRSAHSAEALWQSAGYMPYFIAARKSLAQ